MAAKKKTKKALSPPKIVTVDEPVDVVVVSDVHRFVPLIGDYEGVLEPIDVTQVCGLDGPACILPPHDEAMLPLPGGLFLRQLSAVPALFTENLHPAVALLDREIVANLERDDSPTHLWRRATTQDGRPIRALRRCAPIPRFKVQVEGDGTFDPWARLSLPDAWEQLAIGAIRAAHDQRHVATEREREAKQKLDDFRSLVSAAVNIDRPEDALALLDSARAYATSPSTATTWEVT
tara:strand:+ start:7 stop:711 length:705 start_codon:yes stop_codon:yes gene_type:complete